jgi:hypothetical protein
MSLQSCRVSNLLIWTCVASCDEFCIFKKLYVETFRILPWFMHCQQGEKFVHDLGTWEHLEGVQSGSGSFWKVWCKAGLLGRSNRPQAVRSQRGGLTAQGRRSNHPGQSEQVFALCCIPMLHRCIGLGGVCFGSGGDCICAGGALCVVRAFFW